MNRIPPIDKQEIYQRLASLEMRTRKVSEPLLLQLKQSVQHFLHTLLTVLEEKK